MNYKHSCVVDAGGYYKIFVLVLLEPRYHYKPTDPENPDTQSVEPTMTMEWVVQNYTLAEGERLVDTTQPTTRPYAGAEGFIRPCWDDETAAWTEAATAEEIAAWVAEHPAPEPASAPHVPSLEEDMMTVLVDHEARLTAVEEGVTL